MYVDSYLYYLVIRGVYILFFMNNFVLLVNKTYLFFVVYLALVICEYIHSLKLSMLIKDSPERYLNKKITTNRLGILK